MNMRLSYRIMPEGGVGQDENGNPTEAYYQVKIGCKSYTFPKEEYGELVKAGKKMTASLFKIDEKYIHPITLNEYLDITEEQEE